MISVPTVQQFIDRYPEFAGAVDSNPALLPAILAEAAAETSDWAFPNGISQLNHCLIKAAISAYNSPYAREMLGNVDPAKKTKSLENLLYGKQVTATMGLRCF